MGTQPNTKHAAAADPLATPAEQRSAHPTAPELTDPADECIRQLVGADLRPMVAGRSGLQTEFANFVATQMDASAAELSGCSACIRTAHQDDVHA